MKKEIMSYNEIVTEINSIENNDKNQNSSLIKLTNLFCKVQKNKDLTEDEIQEIFHLAISKAENIKSKFLLNIFARFYDKKKVKTAKYVISLIEGELDKSLVNILDKLEIKSAINNVELNNNDKLISIFKKLKEINNNEKSLYLDTRIYLFILSLIYAKQLYVTNFDVKTTKLLRCFAEEFAVANKNDTIKLSTFTKRFLDDSFDEFSYLVTYLYNDNKELINNLQKQNTMLSETNDEKTKTINEYFEKNNELEKQIVELKNNIATLNEEIEKLKQDNVNAENRNDYNKNFYEQNFQALKLDLINELKDELKLDIQGIEDISDGLSENIQLKIKRRISNIYKTLQKIGD